MGAAGRAFIEDLRGRAAGAGGEARNVEGRPVGAACPARLVADPAAAGPDVAEDDGLRLQPMDGSVEQRPVVLLPLAGRPFAAGTVEPLFEDRAVLATEDAFERPDEGAVIGRRTIAGIVPVPRGNIDAELQPVGGTGVGEFAEDVSLTVTPLALRHRMPAFGRRPEAEAVVVFGGDNRPLEARGTGRGRPLTAVEVGGMEDVFGLGAVAPFGAGEGVRAEMEEHIHLHLLPGHLGGRGAGAERRRGFRPASGGQPQEQGGRNKLSSIHSRF